MTACSNVDLDRGSLDARVTAGATTSVTFTNRSTLGTLRLCKAAGTGITAGTTFKFLTPVGDRDVAAGSCIDLVLPEVNTGDSDGKYGVYEYGCGANCLGTDQGFVVASITCDPARCSSTSESVGTTRVGLSGGERTTVTFTNRSSRGTLRLCKAAGTGITVGTTFKFLTPVGDRERRRRIVHRPRAARGEHGRFGWQVRRLRVLGAEPTASAPIRGSWSPR